jgi:hypothetical protein
MHDWRDQILKEFAPEVARLTLVADPDGLLLEEGILAGIRGRGFELIPFEDHIAFRYAYESRFRSRWDHGEQTDLVVVLRSAVSDLGRLPYDLLQTSRHLSFDLGEIFPSLSYPVVAALDRGDLDALYEAQARHAPGILGDNATKEFVLRHVFEIAPELIRKPSDLLRVLLRRHYQEQHIPALLDERFSQILRQQGGFDEWPLDVIVPDRDAFLAFIQERWPIYLNRSVDEPSGQGNKEEQLNGFAYPGPQDLPFDHDDIRVYIDNLFIEGLLEPVSHEHSGSLSKTWLAVGIRTNEDADRTRRVRRLVEAIGLDIPEEDSRHDEWFHLAKSWAELVGLTIESGTTLSESDRQAIKATQERIDAAFLPWLTQRYAGMANLPPTPPVMLHHLPRFLAHKISDDQTQKVAFILVDGLSLDQWIVVRKELAKKRSEYRFRENAVFAWVPTITSVSRQAAFAGKPPLYYPNSIHATDREPVLWTQFWVDQGLAQQEVAYLKGLGNGEVQRVQEIVDRPNTRVIGLIVDKVDKIMHGMELGAAGMHNQVRQWARGSFLVALFDLLLDSGFQVYLSSDHGNIEAVGCGRPTEGAVADLRGERARIYSDSALRDQVRERFPSAIAWPSTGLPENYFPLLAPLRSAFVRETERIVGHGGATIEELIVPLVQIERRDT